MKYAMKHRTPRQEGWSCRGVGQRVMGGIWIVRGGLGWSGGAGSLRRRGGGSRATWRSVSCSG